ncbi:transposon ISC1778, partial [mine drainage metagenome]
RRVRFGYDRIAHRAAENGCEIVVVNPNSRSPQQERVANRLSMVPTFSGRWYGMRKYKKPWREDDPEYPVQEPKELLQ